MLCCLPGMLLPHYLFVSFLWSTAASNWWAWKPRPWLFQWPCQSRIVCAEPSPKPVCANSDPAHVYLYVFFFFLQISDILWEKDSCFSQYNCSQNRYFFSCPYDFLSFSLYWELIWASTNILHQVRSETRQINTQTKFWLIPPLSKTISIFGLSHTHGLLHDIWRELEIAIFKNEHKIGVTEEVSSFLRYLWKLSRIKV